MNKLERALLIQALRAANKICMLEESMRAEGFMRDQFECLMAAARDYLIANNCTCPGQAIDKLKAEESLGAMMGVTPK